MEFLRGCGQMRIVHCPVNTVMAGWRKIAKFGNMIDNTDHPEASEVYNCKRIDIRGILAHVRDKSEKCAFYRATKFYLEHYLNRVPDIPYNLY